MKTLAVVALLALAACLPSPPPQPPSPPPTTQPPAPTPEPPTPEPTPTPVTCTTPLDGTRVMKAYKLYPRVIDATPLITNAERCRAVGFGDRISCPVVPDEHPQRLVCEHALIGGERPNYEFARDTGNLTWDYEQESDGTMWKARIIGNGTGRIRACYPNGEACSPWLELVF